MRLSPRLGLTLLETIIAVAVFSIMTAMVMEALISYRNLAFVVEDTDIIEEQANRAQRVIARDFSNSGWFYCRAGFPSKRYYPQVHTFTKASWQPYQIIPPAAEDLTVVDASGHSSVVPFTATVATNLSTSLGDAVVFARLQPEGTQASEKPVNHMSSSVVDFNAHPPVRLDNFARARSISSLILNPNATDSAELTSVVWETTPTKIASGLGTSNLYNDANVRLMCYRVMRDPSSGRGSLTRFYSNPGSERNTEAGWIQDEVLATDVVSFRVYTFEMSTWYAGTETNQSFNENGAAGLSQNQIRFVIQFARNLTQKSALLTSDVYDGSNLKQSDASQAKSVKVLQFTVGLRSITNALDQ